MFLAVAALMAGYGCGSGGVSADMVAAESADYGQMAPMEKGAEPTQFSANEVTPRKIIKRGDITFQSSSPAKTREFILKTVADCNGYLSADNVSQYDGKTNYYLEVRVPAQHFEKLLDAVSANAGKIDDKTVRARDVTEEYIDVAARVKTKKELEERYKELLKRAGKVDEILSIEREIGSLRTEIESVEGRLRYLTDQVAYSTLSISFYEQGSSNFGFGTKLVGAVKSGWDALLWFCIGLIHIWPFILMIAAGWWGVARLCRKRKQKKMQS